MMKRKAHFVFVEQTESTNVYLQKLLFTDEPEQFTVVWTDNQTKGKGQGNNKWVSEPGKNLTFSLLFKTENMPPENLFIINKSIALSLVQYLNKQYQLDAAVKWPNDIIVSNMKIAGILIDNFFVGEHIFCIIGIGININQTEFQSMQLPAVSLKNIMGNDYIIKQCLNQLTEILISNLIKTESEDRNIIVGDYDEYLLFRNIERSYMYNNCKVTGVIEGVNNSGQLVFRNSLTGKTDFIDHGNFGYNL